MKVDDVVHHLRRHISSEAPAPQQRIEPERALARRFGCSRQTLRAALDRLENDGTIWRHVGQGTFAGPRPSAVFIRPQVLVEQASPSDLMKARRAVEPAIAAVAAATATTADKARLRDLAEQSCAASSWQDYERIDDAFHKAIAAATANRLLMAVIGTLSSVRGRARWQRQHDAIFQQARRREYSLEQGAMHLAIVDAIAASEVNAARDAMEAHLFCVEGLVLSVSQGRASA